MDEQDEDCDDPRGEVEYEDVSPLVTPVARATLQALPWDDARRSQLPAHESLVNRVEGFAEWAERSGGFTVH